MNTLLSKETEVTSAILQVVVASFRAEQINTVPFAGSWTAGQVGEHLLISAEGVLQTINGPVAPTERDPAEKAGPIKNMFLDFTSKFSSPDFVLPSDAPKNKEALLQSLETTMNGIHASQKRKTCRRLVCVLNFPDLEGLQDWNGSPFSLRIYNGMFIS